MDFLERCLDEFSRHPDAVLVYPRTELIEADGSLIRIDDLTLAVGQGSAGGRLRHFYRNLGLSNPLFGVIRSEVLAKTRLLDSFIESDHVLLAELLMLGRFYEIPDTLFVRRLHENRSTRAYGTEGELLRWFDTSKGGERRSVPRPIRLAAEYTLSVFRIPLSPWQRIGCLYATIRWQWFRAIRIVIRSCFSRVGAKSKDIFPSFG